MSDPGSEKRKFKRKNVDFLITYQILEAGFGSGIDKGQEHNAIMLDISQAGIAILVNINIPALSFLSLRFAIYDLSVRNKNNRLKSAQATGIVKNVTPTVDGKFRLGVLFTKIDKMNTKLIANFIKKTTVSG